jgi:FkbM family methyltransferase
MRVGLFQTVVAGGAELCIRGLKIALPRLSRGDRSWLARRATRDRYAAPTAMLASFFSEALAGWHNQQYDVHRNGEAALIDRLRGRFTPKVVFDVGANVGDWALHVHATWPDAEVHAFEIDPATAQALRERLPPGAATITVNALGLAERDGEVTIFVQPGVSTATTMLRTASGAKDEALLSKTVRVTTGDVYVRQHGMEHIDLLKLDVEGVEPQVLDGFRDCFARNAITIVQFEYGAANLRVRYLLEDFYRFFEERGFVVGKIYPEGIAFKPYEPEDEDFRGPNFLAVRSERADLVEALRCAPLRMRN